MSHFTELRGSRDLLINLTQRELRGKYKRSVLGWGWSLLNPLASMVIFTVVFSVLLKQKPDVGDPSGLELFPLFLLCGLLPWNFLSNSMNGGMTTLVGNANLVKKVYFPREVLVAANVGSWLFSLMVEFAVLSVALLIAGNMVLPWLPLVALVVVVQTVFAFGLALVFSIANVYFRDTQHLLGIVLQVWFYGTPIIYPLSLVQQHAHGALLTLYKANPMVEYVKVYRNLMYDLRFPAAIDVAYILLTAALSIIVGALVFRRFEGRLAEEL